MSDSGTINKVILLGMVKRAPRLHKNGDGRNELRCILFTEELYWHNGEQVEKEEEHFIRLSENLLKESIKPGERLYIEGKIKTISFVDEQSVKRYKTEIMAIKICLLGYDPDFLGKEAVTHSISYQSKRISTS